uniref:Uncharacterized protein n=1 Tax=viral metagenome TaxID=1070528 RepID=A0A6C0BMA5_9ZZZZ
MQRKLTTDQVKRILASVTQDLLQTSLVGIISASFSGIEW